MIGLRGSVNGSLDCCGKTDQECKRGSSQRNIWRLWDDQGVGPAHEQTM